MSIDFSPKIDYRNQADKCPVHALLARFINAQDFGHKIQLVQ